jgi:hypothetical protein
MYQKYHQQPRAEAGFQAMEVKHINIQNLIVFQLFFVLKCMGINYI